ncbi:MAG: ABC transporter ATP-binding protein [Eubacteriales bacterium]
MGGEVLISVRNLARVYGRGPSSVKALDVERLDIVKGDFVAVTGPSGCGKTTLLNLLGGLDGPSRGDIFFAGVEISGLGEGALCRYRREKVGFVFQSYCLLPTLSALQNVLAPALPLGNGRQSRERARELLRLVGLAGKEGRRPGELSGGEQQRVAVARALLLDPELILADEPTGNLDSAAGAEIVGLLQSLNDGGKTVLVASHDRRVAEACRRNIRLADGRLAGESGTWEDD